MRKYDPKFQEFLKSTLEKIDFGKEEDSAFQLKRAIQTVTALLSGELGKLLNFAGETQIFTHFTNFLEIKGKASEHSEGD